MEQSLKITLEEKTSEMKGYAEKLANLRRSL